MTHPTFKQFVAEAPAFLMSDRALERVRAKALQLVHDANHTAAHQTKTTVGTLLSLAWNVPQDSILVDLPAEALIELARQACSELQNVQLSDGTVERGRMPNSDQYYVGVHVRLTKKR